MVDFITYYFKVIVYTVGIPMICGIAAALLQKAIYRLAGGSFGYKAVMCTAILGTPIHELGHALMCLLFGHRIVDIKLYSVDKSSGALGYVSHTYDSNSLYQRIGNFFIGIGPIFSGVGAITLVLFMFFPSAADTFFSSAMGAVGAGTLTDIVYAGAGLIRDMLFEDVMILLKVLGFIIIISVMLHINLSVPDIKSSASGFITYSAVVLLFSAATFIAGRAVSDSIADALGTFSAYCLVIFALIFIFLIFTILIAALIGLIKRLAGQ